MSRPARPHDFHRPEESAPPPPGSGVILAVAIGLVGMLLGTALFVLGAGVGWAVFAWLAANTCGLLLLALCAAPRRRPATNPCRRRPCRPGNNGKNRGSLANV